MNITFYLPMLNHILNMNTHQVMENSENLKKPDYHNNYNYDIQDTLDFPIHGDVCIDKP